MTTITTTPSTAEELVAAFTQLGPAWARWTQCCAAGSSVSHIRRRLLHQLECAGTQTMTELAQAFHDLLPEHQRQLLEITPVVTEALRSRAADRGGCERRQAADRGGCEQRKGGNSGQGPDVIVTFGLTIASTM